MARTIQFESRLIQVPDDATDDEVAGILESASTPAPDAPVAVAPEQSGLSKAWDVVKAVLPDSIAGRQGSPQRESILQGVDMKPPPGMTDDVNLEANRYARDRSGSPQSVMYTKANATDATDRAVALGRNVLEATSTIGPVRQPEASVGSVLSGLASDLGTGVKRADAGLDRMFADASGSKYLEEQSRKKLSQTDLTDALNTPKFESDTAQGIYSGVSSTLKQAPAIAAALLTRSPGLALGGMVAPMVPEAYGKYRERGAAPALALAAAFGEAGTEYLTEKMPMIAVISGFGKKGFAAFAKDVLAKEIPGEQVATLVQDAIDTAVANPTKSWGDYLAERPGAAYQTLVATVTQAGLLSGGAAAAKYVSDAPDRAATLAADQAKASALSKWATLSAPKVQDQPTIPVAPVVNRETAPAVAAQAGVPNGNQKETPTKTQVLSTPQSTGLPPTEGAQAVDNIASLLGQPAAPAPAPAVEAVAPTQLSPQAQALQARGQQAQNANNETDTTTPANVARFTGPTGYANNLGTNQPGLATGTTSLSTPDSGGSRLDRAAQRSGEVAQRSDNTGRPTTVPEAGGDLRGSSTTAVAVGSDSPAQTYGRYVLAATAPKADLLSNQLAVKRAKGVVIQPVEVGTPLTEEQTLVSALAHSMGKTLTWVERSSGPLKEMPDGWVNNIGGKHLFLDANGAKPLLEIVLHEGTHGLPDHIRTPLRDFVVQRVAKEGRDGFIRQYQYENLTPERQDEEVLAYVSQQIGRKPEFIQELKAALGNKNFSEFAKVLLAKMNEWLGKGDSQFDGEFLDKHVKDVAAIQSELAKAYAQAMQEQGLQPDESLAEPVFATKPIEVGAFQTVQNKNGTMLVKGDPTQIRKLIPEGIKGRVTKDGVYFTHSDAPRVRHALEGNKTAYSRSGDVTEQLARTAEGKYLGAPEKFNTPGKIPTLRKWLMKLTKEGEAGRFWYENSSKAILRMVGGNITEARKLAALLAIYSPQAKVDTNGTFALRAWAQYKAGQPINVKTGDMDSKAQRAMDNVDEFWSGEKTGNFVTNLLRVIDPSLAQGATIDIWMMRSAQYSNDAPTKTQYAFMENETNRIARELGWEPQQVQAAIWVAMKARMENDGVKKATEAKSIKNGWIHYALNSKGKKARVIDNAQAHRNNWLAHTIAYDPSTNDTQRAKFDFEDSLRRHIGQVSWEARPGRSTGVLSGVNDAPYAQQVEFQQAVQKALLDDNGKDILALQLGLLMDGEDLLAPGVWQSEVAAGMQKKVAMAPDAASAPNLDPNQKKNLDVYSAVLGLLLRQEGVGWHRPFYNGNKSSENGVELQIGRPFTPDEAKAVWSAINKRMLEQGVAQWEQGAGMISSPVGMRVVNFGALEDNKTFRKIVESTVPDLPMDAGAEHFTSDGNLVANDWKANPNGQTFVQQISEAGRSDLLGWSRDVLAPRVQAVFDEFSKKYDWGNPGTIAFSNKAERDGPTAKVDGADGRGAQPHAVDLTGIHFSKQARTRLDGRYNGTGLKGLEAKRLAESADSRIKERVYFYVDEGKGLTPEAGVGGVAHKANIKNLYNTAGDPLKLFKANDLNGSESRVLDAGYNGYYFPNASNSQGIAVVLGQASRSLQVEPTDFAKGNAPTAPVEPYKRGLTSKELGAIDLAAVQSVAPSAKLRSGTLSVDQGELDAARAELSKQGITLPAGPAFSNKRANYNQDVTLEIPVEGGGMAKMTVNARAYIKQLDARQEALQMVKECMG